jgi:hypothetical protein
MITFVLKVYIYRNLIAWVIIPIIKNTNDLIYILPIKKDVAYRIE